MAEKRPAHAGFCICLRRIIHRDRAKLIVLATENIAQFGAADSHGVLQHGLKYGLQDCLESG